MAENIIIADKETERKAKILSFIVLGVMLSIGVKINFN